MSSLKTFSSLQCYPEKAWKDCYQRQDSRFHLECGFHSYHPRCRGLGLLPYHLVLYPYCHWPIQIYLLIFSCRGDGWYVMCAKSVAVSYFAVFIFKDFVFLRF